MKKSIAIILGTLMLICFSSVTTYQYKRIKYLENIIETKDSKFKSIQVKLSDVEDAFSLAISDNKKLNKKIVLLEGRISKYKQTIKRLKNKIASQELQIKTLTNKLSESQKTYIATVTKLELLQSKAKNKLTKSDKIAIKKLADQKVALTEKIDAMYINRNSVIEKKDQLAIKEEKFKKQAVKLTQAKDKIENIVLEKNIPKAEKITSEQELDLISQLDLGTIHESESTELPAPLVLSDKNGEATTISPNKVEAEKTNDAKFQKLNRILKDTWVKYYSIQLLKEKDGKPIRRLYKKKNNWNFTKVRFDIFSKTMKDIAGGEFQIQIIDAKTNKPLPSEESNPMFPDSESGSNGVDFVSNNQKLRLTLNNHQFKKGKNYYLLVNYKFDGKLYPIANSKLPIVKNRKVVF